MLWLCLCFPHLPVEVFTRGSPDGAPLAIGAGEGRRQVIVACNREARALGLCPGMALGAAQARVPGLSVRPRDEAAEAAALTRVAAWTGQFTPSVHLSSPESVLLEVAESLALFGGLSRLLGKVRRGLDALGYQTTVAAAPTPLGATWLARVGDERPVTDRASLYTALALTDECSLAGIVRAHLAAGDCGLKLLVGSEIRLENGPRLVLLAMDREGYGNLCELITRGRRSAPKGRYRLTRADLASGLEGCVALLIPERALDLGPARWLAALCPCRAWVAVERRLGPGERGQLTALRQLSDQAGLPLVAAGDVHMHVRRRLALQHTLTAIRLKTTVQAAGFDLMANGERHLRPRERLARLYPQELLEGTVRIAERCRFSLDELRYEYPEELVPPGETPASHLRTLTQAGMRERWPQGVPEKVRRQVEHELALIAELGYEPYFLTVHDIVRYAKDRGILCQGRGSAANSAVCYCLGVTEVDPARLETLFERFISRERHEPPDIDVDFEHARREEVIQYIYRKCGRERAALAATVITYRPRSALRDVGRALGLDLAQVDRLAKSMAWWDGRAVRPERLCDAGFDPETPVMARLLDLVNTLIGFPRHLSQHVGGFVIARDRLSRLVPIENAAMPKRTVIQWDKDDLDPWACSRWTAWASGCSAPSTGLSTSSRATGESA